MISSSQPDLAPNRAITAGTGLLLIAIGVAVLVGWTFDVSALSGLSGQITMKANAAFALLGAGVALLFLTSPSPAARRVGRAGALMAGLLGAMTLSEHIA